MYRAYWGMEFNPFDKEITEKQLYRNHDFNEMTKRLEYLKNVKGIGLFTGLPGTGKTACCRAFVSSLNPSLYKVVYLPMTTISTSEFYRDLAKGLGSEACYRKTDNFRNIQERIRNLYREQKTTLTVLVDEAQYLNQSILADLKILMNFEMDSKNYAALLLSGQPTLNNTLSMHVIIGCNAYGRYVCIPDWGIGSALAAPDDCFWNREQLGRRLGTVDAIILSEALKVISKALEDMG